MGAGRRAGLLSVAAAVCGLAGGLLVTVGTVPSPAAAACTPRLLVLSAMPLELDPLLAEAAVDPGPPVELDSRSFVTGTLAGHAVVMGLTGIGPANALATTKAAFSQFQCGGGLGISGVLFSGTSGGDFIGDVFVPSRWTEDGVHFVDSDATMLGVAAAATKALPLEQTTPTGDPACVCAMAGGVQTPVTVQHAPVVIVGGEGLTSDPFDGHALPCAPAGSDVFGCVPCRLVDRSQADQTTTFVQGVPPLVDPGVVTSNLQPPPAGTYVTSDEETAVVAQVAHDNGVPFIGFRAASDGPGNSPGTGGDPLMLPGFPAQFLVYRQLAADNAATAAIAFLGAWSTAG
jgi:nucleoside phosphorylase